MPKPVVTKQTAQRTTTTRGKVKPKAKKPLAPLEDRVGKDPALLARALKDPGLRSKLSDKHLTPELRETRRLNQPVTPGSSLSNREAEKQASTATDLYFGPGALGKEEQRGRDVVGWYDQYRNDLREHERRVGDINAQTQQAIGGLSQGIRGLGEQGLAEQKAGDANQARVTGAAGKDQTATASDASRVRQAMIGSMGAGEAGRGASRQSYASSLANVVAPGQKLQAAAVGQGRVRDLDAKMKAFRSKTLGDTIGGEREALSKAAERQADQELALRIAGINSATDITQSKISAQTTQRGQDVTAKNARAGRVVAKRGQDISAGQRAADRAAREAAAARAASKKTGAKEAVKPPRYGPGSLTQAQENQIRTRIDAQVSKLGSAGEKASKLSNSQIIQALIKDGLSRDEAHVVISLFRNKGSIGPDGIKSAHRIGLHVGGRYKKAKPKDSSKLGQSSIDKVVAAVQGAVK